MAERVIRVATSCLPKDDGLLAFDLGQAVFEAGFVCLLLRRVVVVHSG
ncbi:hypothetical protein [Amycolatopsis sp.]|nr:hypothetical protein [Amycolatopsis sp.]